MSKPIFHYRGKRYAGPGVFYKQTIGDTVFVAQECPYCNGHGEDKARIRCWQCGGRGFIEDRRPARTNESPDFEFLAAPTEPETQE